MRIGSPPPYLPAIHSPNQQRREEPRPAAAEGGERPDAARAIHAGSREAAISGALRARNRLFNQIRQNNLPSELPQALRDVEESAAKLEWVAEALFRHVTEPVSYGPYRKVLRDLQSWMQTNGRGGLRDVLLCTSGLEQSKKVDAVLRHASVTEWLRHVEDGPNFRAPTALRHLIRQSGDRPVPPSVATVGEALSSLVISNETMLENMRGNRKWALNAFAESLGSQDPPVNLQTVLMSASSDAVIMPIKEWLDLPGGENKFGWQGREQSRGWKAITELHAYFGKPLADKNSYLGNTASAANHPD